MSTRLLFLASISIWPSEQGSAPQSPSNLAGASNAVELIGATDVIVQHSIDACYDLLRSLLSEVWTGGGLMKASSLRLASIILPRSF